MPDDETPGETPAETTVVVIPDDPAESPAVETGDTTVIVADAPAENPAGDITPLDLNVVQRLTRLEGRVDSLDAEVFAVAVDTDVAQATADLALESVDVLAEQDEAIVEAVDEAIVETIEDTEIEREDGEQVLDAPDIAPTSAKVHPLFRSLSDWTAR